MATEILKISLNDPDIRQINHAVEVLRLGGLVILPTETVYGLAANYKSKIAYEKLYEIKERPKDKPFALAIADKEAIDGLAKNIPVFVYKLVEKFWPGPLTIILNAKESGQIAFRMPDNKVSLMIIDMLGMPVYLTSANISGKPPCITVEDSLKDLNDKVELAVDTGKSELEIASTIIKVVGNTYEVVREGVIKDVDIKRVVETKKILFVCTGNSCRSVMAEGLLKKYLGKRGDIHVSSAGIITAFGMGPTHETIKMLSFEGIDMRGHAGRKVTHEMLRGSDLILVMEKFHEERIKFIEPSVRNRVFLLKEFAKIKDGSVEIKDPIGRGDQVYFEVFTIIKDAVEQIVKII